MHLPRPRCRPHSQFPGKPCSPHHRRLILEPLEDRRLLSLAPGLWQPNAEEWPSALISSPVAGADRSASARDGEDAGEIRGSKWNDLDGNGVWDQPEEPGVEGWTITLDEDGDGTPDRTTETGPDGSYVFTDLTPGTYMVAEELRPGWERTFPAIPSGGVEVQVNQEWHGDQGESQAGGPSPSVAVHSDGSFVVVWPSNGPGAVGWDAFARLYNADGTPRGSEFRANTYTANDQLGPSVAIDASGNFVVVWQSLDQDGGNWGVFGQCFRADGTPNGSEFPVNVEWQSHQLKPEVAMTDSGRFVVVWQSYQGDGSDQGVYARIFDQCTPVTGDIQVNTYAQGAQTWPSVETDSEGDFVVAWMSQGQDADGWGIFAQRLDPNGRRVGDEFPVNQYFVGDQRTPSVGLDREGNSVIVWASEGQDGSGYGVYRRRYDQDGVPLEDELPVNTYTSGDQAGPRCTTDQEGNSVVVWRSYDEDGSGYGAFGQYFTSDGTRKGAEFRVNTYTVGDQVWPSPAIDGDGNFVVAWMSHGQDGDGWGIFARQFTVSMVPAAHTVSLGPGQTVAGIDFGNHAELDFGDAPDPTYPTLLANDGARHALGSGLFLGAAVDADLDGQPSPAAMGDDNNGSDDEDGVVLRLTITPGRLAKVQVEASAAGFLYGWIDFNHDGSWEQPVDQIFNEVPIYEAGVQELTFQVPANIPLGNTYTRFRVTTLNVGLGPAGLAPDGEVEDYRVRISSRMDGRHIFYNQSAWDGNSPLPNAQDDLAIAPDPADCENPSWGKTPLLPGQTATFQNYTSYSRGINGITVDIAALPGVPTPADFVFKVGNNNNPAGWAVAPASTSVTVRAGAGVGGSDRVTIIWPSSAIKNQWLQVTVLATANTGLAAPDVFYWGNAIGETGNSTTDAKVNAFDMLGARDNPRSFLNPASICFPYDFNRDKRVNATDMLIARDNPTSFLNALRLITVPGGKSRESGDGAHSAAHGARSAPYGQKLEHWGWLDELAEVVSASRSPKRGLPAAGAIEALLLRSG